MLNYDELILKQAKSIVYNTKHKDLEELIKIGLVKYDKQSGYSVKWNCRWYYVMDY